eukprot:1157454-Pelagomonas_calceolata.AAC.8
MQRGAQSTTTQHSTVFRPRLALSMQVGNLRCNTATIPSSNKAMRRTWRALRVRLSPSFCCKGAGVDSQLPSSSGCCGRSAPHAEVTAS